MIFHLISGMDSMEVPKLTELEQDVLYFYIGMGWPALEPLKDLRNKAKVMLAATLLAKKAKELDKAISISKDERRKGGFGARNYAKYSNPELSSAEGPSRKGGMIAFGANKKMKVVFP